jgi:hypothetical protein
VLALHTVAKPALLRHLLLFAVSAPAQMISYNKMLGQLTDAGNTTTLAHYLHLLGTALLASGLEKLRGTCRSAGRALVVGATGRERRWIAPPQFSAGAALGSAVLA